MAEMEPKKSNIVAFRWWRTGITGTATITNMRVSSSDKNRNAYYHYMPFSGSVVRFQLDSLIKPVGSGSLTGRLLKAGTGATTVGGVVLSSSASLGYTGSNGSNLNRGAYAVSAGDKLQVVYTAHTFDAGASSMIEATVFVHIEQN